MGITANHLNIPNTFTASDDNARKAEISYANAKELKMNAAGQLSSGPTHTTIRRVDQLIPVDDISQLRSVQAMLEEARINATTVGSTPYSAQQSSPPDSNLQTQSTTVANNPLDTDSDLQTPTPAPTPPTPVPASTPPTQ